MLSRRNREPRLFNARRFGVIIIDSEVRLLGAGQPTAIEARDATLVYDLA
jgi:hypothetical protein